MALDFQQVQDQVRQIGEGALAREEHLRALKELANQLLEQYSQELDFLRSKVAGIVASRDASLRCAIPVDPQNAHPEPLNAAFTTPALPAKATILAADGSQITPDRHAQVLYSLINVGAIRMTLGVAEPPTTYISSQLFYDENLYTASGMISEALLSILRDRHERTMLADLASLAEPPVITFTDGPIELWEAKGTEEEARAFQQNLEEYLQSLERLCEQQVIVGGYVDKPMADLVVRLLEVAAASPEQLDDLRNFHPLRGVRDLDLFRTRIGPGERSAVFAIQSQSARRYRGLLGLHFFYLNVGREDHPWLARVEIPAWVLQDPEKLDNLQAVLVDQCRMMGGRHFPYLLHRAHETALVTLQEKEQVTQMIALELRRRGVEVGEASHKQESKALPGRMRYS